MTWDGIDLRGTSEVPQQYRRYRKDRRIWDGKTERRGPNRYTSKYKPYKIVALISAVLSVLLMGVYLGYVYNRFSISPFTSIRSAVNPVVYQSTVSGTAITGVSSREIGTIYYATQKTGSTQWYVEPVKVVAGVFTTQIRCREGQGSYSVYFGPDANHFYGYPVTVQSSVTTDPALLPDYYVDSDNSYIIALSNQICKGLTDNNKKTAAIHDWVASNLTYDLSATYSVGWHQASWVLARKSGQCGDYAVLAAALLRVQQIPTVIPVSLTDHHAWNRTGSVVFDATWDSGYVMGRVWHHAFSRNYFAFTTKSGHPIEEKTMLY